jgi:hypothetical protein
MASDDVRLYQQHPEMTILMLFEDGRRFGLRMEPRYQTERKGGYIAIILGQVACGSRNQEHQSCGVFLMANGHRQERTGSDEYDGLESLLR